MRRRRLNSGKIRLCAAALLSVGGLLYSGGLFAADIQSVEFETREERYIAKIRVRLAVPQPAAFAVMQDYANLTRINPAVLEAKVLELMPGTTRLHTRVKLCVLLVCKEIKQVQDMRTFGFGEMNARVLPDQSDLEYGYAYWQFRDCAGETCLLFRAEIDPKFWVPPVIGSWAIQRVLRQEALMTSEGIEQAVRDGL